MDTKKIRKKSIKLAKKYGYETNKNLPILDDFSDVKSKDQIVDRLLILFTLVSCSYGFNKKEALSWLEKEKLVSSLSNTELEYLDNKNNSIKQTEVEALWALAWSLNLVQDLDFTKLCSNDFISIFPNLLENESSSELRSRASIRKEDDLIAKLDLSFCLHWAIRECPEEKYNLENYVIEERRKALEWIVSSVNWDEVILDT